MTKHLVNSSFAKAGRLLTWESLVLGDPGVCGFDCTDGGVMGPGNLSPSVLRVEGDPILGC